MILIEVSSEAGLWLDPHRIEALVEGDHWTTICLQSGQEIKAHGITALQIAEEIQVHLAAIDEAT